MENLKLRPKQQRSVALTHAAMKDHRKVLMVAPTGAGKRYMLVYWAQLGLKHNKRMLFVTDRRILVDQLSRECENFGVPYGIIMGNEPRNEHADVQIASIQTLQRRGYKDMPSADLVAIDEGHKASKAYKDLFDVHPKAKVLGVTATPVGAKGISLVPSLYDVMVEGMVNSELIADGHLLKTECWCPCEPDLTGVEITSTGEFHQKQLAGRVEECTVLADIFKAWDPFNHMQTVLFAPRVKFAHGLAQQFRERGFKAAVVEANTNKKDRQDIFRQFADGTIQVLISVDVLREGFDETSAQCGIDLQPNKQFRTYWQKVGRIKRPHPGQGKAVWLDFAGNFWRFDHPDEDPNWAEVSEDKSINDLIAEKKGIRCKSCGAPDVYKGQCQSCGERTEAKDPWSCPKCTYTLSPWERLIGGKCPNCGHKAGAMKKRVRMRDGTLKQVSALERNAVKRRRKSGKSEPQKVWDKYRYVAMNSGKKLGAAASMFAQEMGYRPEGRGLKYCPEKNSADWYRYPKDVYPWMGTKGRQ